MRFRNRLHAGRLLARLLLAERDDLAGALVLALPRGGVPVAFEVALALQLPLDVQPVRKLGVPGHEELAFGALTAGEDPVIANPEAVRALGLDAAAIDEVVRTERAELARRARLYGAGRPPCDLCGRNLVVVDDGLATGATMLAAVRGLKRQGAALVMAAAPVASPEAMELLAGEADRVRSVLCPEAFMAVGAWYRDFSQTSDDEVCALLAEAQQRKAG